MILTITLLALASYTGDQLHTMLRLGTPPNAVAVEKVVHDVDFETCNMTALRSMTVYTPEFPLRVAEFADGVYVYEVWLPKGAVAVICDRDNRVAVQIAFDYLEEGQ